MNPEHQAWNQLRSTGAAQLRPGFADRVLREVREKVEAAPSLISQFMVSAAMVALCFAAIAFVESRHAAADDSSNQWQEIATSSDAGFNQ